jgi:hypothetical protein
MQDGKVVGCSAHAAFRFEKKNTCPTCKSTKSKIDHELCVADMALFLAGELRDLQTDMFEGHGH